MRRPIVGFAGMTHLGINSAVASAERGFEILCFDPDQDAIARLDRGELSVAEPGLPEMLASNRARIIFSARPEDLARCDVVYVAPDVPTNDQGESDLGPIRRLIGEAERHIRPEAILVVLSQVPPGFTRSLPRDHAALYYQVETLIFGRAVERAMYPERFIIGCADPATSLPDHFRTYLEAFGCPLLPMRYESAELAKISINCCLVASVSVANTLAELCEKIGAEWNEIVPALKLDRRIGQYSYLAPGLGIAGGNLERDLATVCKLSDAHGTDSGVVRAWIQNSAYRKDWALRTLASEVLARHENPCLAVLGLAYKENTHSVKNSASVALLRSLGSFQVTAFDPVVVPDVAWHAGLRPADDALAACAGADALLIMTPWDAFKALKPAAIRKQLAGDVVLDPYRVLDPAACQAAGLRHLTLGSAAPC